MKKQLIALAAAAAIAPAAFAGNASFGGDANVEGYALRANTDVTDGTEADSRGYTNRIRVKGTYKTDGNVSVNTRIILNDSNWTGDNHSEGVQGVYQNSANDAVAVDYGFIQAPILGWTFRFGRQVANWGNCFLTCDDRRDRILAMKRFGSTTVILLNDKRAGGSLTSSAGINVGYDDVNGNGEYDAGDNLTYSEGFSTGYSADETADTGEGDLYTAAAVGVINGWQWGLLLGKWMGEESYILDEVYAISPFFKGKAGPVKLEGTLNILGGGNEEGGAAFTDTAVSAYVKAGMNVSTVLIEGQVVVVSGGGLVAGGFDTFSMFVNNSPDNNLSNVAQLNPVYGLVNMLGGLGQIGASEGAGRAYADDQYMLGFRVSGKAGKIGWKAAMTYLNSEDSMDDLGIDYAHDFNLTTFEGGITYDVAKSTQVYLNAGIGTLEQTAAALGSSATAEIDLQAATIGINTTF